MADYSAASGGLDITLQQGTSFIDVWEYDDEDGDPVNMTGWTATMKVIAGDGTTVATLGTAGGTITLGNGTITFAVPYATTATYAVGNYSYDLLLTSSGGIRYKPAMGKFIVTDTISG